MANTLLTPSVLARQAWANLYQSSVLSQLVHRDYEADFNGAVGDTITIRKPATFVANQFTSTITVQNATEQGVDVSIDTHLDVSFQVTTKELTLDIADFNAQFMSPAMQAIIQGVEAKLLGLRDDVTQSVGGAGTEAWDDPRVLIDAGVILNQNHAPQGNRFAVVGPVTQGEWLKDPLFVQADQRGDTDGLRQASIGRKLGFDVYMSDGIVVPDTPATGEETTEGGIAFHRNALALVTRTPALPAGAANAAVYGANGFGVRVVSDYNINSKAQIVSVDLMLGAAVLDADLAVKITGPLAT